MSEVTRILSQISQGDPTAAEQLCLWSMTNCPEISTTSAESLTLAPAEIVSAILDGDEPIELLFTELEDLLAELLFAG